MYGPNECFGLYVFDGRRGRGGLRQLATAPTLQGIGCALATNIEDCQEADKPFPEGFVGVRDIVNRKWIISPFPGGA